MQASEVMTRNIVSIGRDAPIRDAIRLMLDNKVSGLPVVDAGGKVIGILTEGDLLHRSEIATEKHHWRWLEFVLGPGRMASEYVRTHGRVVGELMTHEVVTIGVDTPLGDIVALMEHHHVKRLPVIDDGKLAGIVSRADLLAALGKALDAQAAPAASDEDIRARILAELEKVEWAPRDGLTIAVADGDRRAERGRLRRARTRGAARRCREHTGGQGDLGSPGLGRARFRDRHRGYPGSSTDDRAAHPLNIELWGSGRARWRYTASASMLAEPLPISSQSTISAGRP